MSGYYAEYSARYRNIAFERRGNVVQMRLHTRGEPLRWGANADSVHAQLCDAFRDLSRDTELRVLILAGTGDRFCTELDTDELPAKMTSLEWSRLLREGRELLMNFIDLEVPVIAAVNGPAHIHSELPVLADIVLAAEGAEFADRAHFVQGVVPGDGVHVVWPLLLGPNRARHFLLTGAVLGAREALALGVVAEVLPADALQARAWQIAAELERKPLVALRNTRLALTRRLRRELNDDLDAGLAYEGLGMWAFSE